MKRSRSLFDRYFTPKTDISATVATWTGISVFCLVLCFWFAAAYFKWMPPGFLPSPADVVRSGIALGQDGTLFTHIWSSLRVILLGFVLSPVVAVPLGIVMGSFRIVQAGLEPLIGFFRYLPVTSMIPLLILWIGIGIEQKVAVIVIGIFFQQVIMMADVSAGVSRDMVNASYTLGASRGQVVTRVLIPASLPGAIDTLRVTMGLAWTYLVVAELVAANSGLGYMSLQAMRGFRTDQIFLAILVIGLFGLASDLLFRVLRRQALPWSLYL